MPEYSLHKFPKSRIATIDVCDIGLKKHHIAALIEVDVTASRQKIRAYNKNTGNISFSAWLIKAIGAAIHGHKRSGAYLRGKREVVLFEDVNISFLVEKELNGEKVPFPILFKKVNELSLEDITRQLTNSKNEQVNEKDIVLHRKSTKAERLYYHMPGFMRRFIWKIMLRQPVSTFNRMGNAAVSSVGMMGRINGWFIPISIHPVCFGIGSIIKKPVVVNDKIEIREMMNMTILIDHDVMDGAPMARFIAELSKNIERGIYL